MAERITIEKMKALEAEYEVTIPEEIKKLLCDGEMDRSRRKVHLKYGEWEDETFLHVNFPKIPTKIPTQNN